MIEVKNKLYTQRFFAESRDDSDWYSAVNYTSYRGEDKIPFWYKKTKGNTGRVVLSDDLDVILSRMKSNTRNEVKRAEKEGCKVEFGYDYNSFVAFYNRFSSAKGRNEVIDEGLLSKYSTTVISSVSCNGVILAMHAIVVDEEGKLAMLLYSGSIRLEENANRKLVGWGNRYLHFKEFEYLKDIGIETYEWNGVCVNPDYPDRYRIGQFKMSFGGELMENINIQTPLFTFMRFVKELIGR